MKTLILTYFVLGILLNLAVWWATDAAALEDWQRCRLLQPSPVMLQVTRQVRVVNLARISHPPLRRAVRNSG